MANRFFGEASFEVEGKTYTLRLDFNTMARLEAKTGGNAFDLISEFESGRTNATGLINLFWAMLQKHHPGLDDDAAGELLSAAPEAIAQAVAAAAPEKGPDTGKKPRAPRSGQR